MATVAYRATRSRQKFVKMPQVKAELAKVLDSEVKPELLYRFNRVTANWNTKISFRSRKFIKIDSISVTVFPFGKNKQIWGYVSFGTQPHKIRAKNAPMLAFQWGGYGSYKPKTAPIGKFGGPGTVTGGTLRFMKEVNHPGSEGRKFEEAIRADYKKDFSRTINNAFRRIIRRL